MILDTEPAALGRHLVAGTQYRSEPLPTFLVYRPTISFADQMSAFEGDNGTCRALIEVVLDQFSNKVFGIKADEIVPKAGYSIEFGDKLGIGGVAQITDNDSIHDIRTERTVVDCSHRPRGQGVLCRTSFEVVAWRLIPHLNRHRLHYHGNIPYSRATFVKATGCPFLEPLWRAGLAPRPASSYSSGP